MPEWMKAIIAVLDSMGKELHCTSDDGTVVDALVGPECYEREAPVSYSYTVHDKP